MKGKTKAKVSLLVSAIGMMTFLAPAAVIANMVHEFPNTNVTIIQMIISIPSLISIPMGIVAARLAKKFLKKSLIIFGTLCYLVGGMTPYFIHPSAEFILACSCLIGVGMGIAMTALTALICEFFEGPERGAMLGLYAAFISIGGTVSALLGGRLGASQWYHAFLAYLMLVPIIVLEIFLLPKGHLDQEAEGEQQQTSKKMSKEVWVIALTGFIFYTCINVINNNAAMLVSERTLGGSIEASYITTCYTMAGLVTGFFIGNIIIRLKRRTIALAYVLGTIGLVLGFVGTNIVVICAGAFISGVGFCIFAATANYHVSDMSTPSTLTFSIAFLSAVINLGQALSPVIINAVSSVAGPAAGVKFIVAGVMTTVIAVLALLFFRNPNLPIAAGKSGAIKQANQPVGS